MKIWFLTFPAGPKLPASEQVVAFAAADCGWRVMQTGQLVAGMLSETAWHSLVGDYSLYENLGVKDFYWAVCL